MVRGVSQGTVVHHTHPRHLLNRTKAPSGAGGRGKESEVCISAGQGAEALPDQAWQRAHWQGPDRGGAWEGFSVPKAVPSQFFTASAARSGPRSGWVLKRT